MKYCKPIKKHGLNCLKLVCPLKVGPHTKQNTTICSQMINHKTKTQADKDQYHTAKIYLCSSSNAGFMPKWII